MLIVPPVQGVLHFVSVALLEIFSLCPHPRVFQHAHLELMKQMENVKVKQFFKRKNLLILILGCSSAISSCAACTSSSVCTSCNSGLYVSISQCVPLCPPETYPNNNGVCESNEIF